MSLVSCNMSRRKDTHLVHDSPAGGRVVAKERTKDMNESSPKIGEVTDGALVDATLLG